MSKHSFSRYYKSITANEEQPQAQPFFGNQLSPIHRPNKPAFFQAKHKAGSVIQKRCTSCEDEDKLQKKEAERSDTAVNPATIENRLQDLAGKGQPMPQPVLNNMESSFGTDFSEVSIHTDDEAAEMNQGLGAQAFTSGNDIYFNKGKYNPGSDEGKQLLAHELTHTIQQGGAVNGKAPHNAGTVQREEEHDCDKKDEKKEGSKEEAKANETTESKGHCIVTDKPVDQPAEDQEEPDEEEKPADIEANAGAGVDERQSHAPPAEEGAPDKEKNVQEKTKDQQPTGPCDPQPGKPGAAQSGGSAAKTGGAPAQGGGKGGGQAAAPTAAPAAPGAAPGGDAGKDSPQGTTEDGEKPAGKGEGKAASPGGETDFLQNIAAQGVSPLVQPDGLGEAASPALKTQRDEVMMNEQSASASLDGKDSAVSQLMGQGVRYMRPPTAKGEEGEKAVKDYDNSTSLANTFLKETGRRVHEFINQGKSTAANFRQQRQDARQTLQDEITTRRNETKSEFARLRGSANAKANAALKAVEARYNKTVAQVNVKFILNNLALTLAKMLAQPKLDKALQTQLTKLDDVYSTGYDNLIDTGDEMGRDAESRAEQHAASYRRAEGASPEVQYKVQNEVKDGFWDGYLTYNRYMARADSAKETGKQYKEGMEKQAQAQADDMMCGKSVDIEVVNTISAEGHKTLQCTYDNAVKAVTRNRDAALMQASHARQELTKAIKNSQKATITQLREKEAAQLQLINDYGIRQAMAIERDIASAINSFVTGVTEAAAKVLELLTGFTTQSATSQAPAPLELNKELRGMQGQVNTALGQASGALNTSATGTEGHVDNTTGKSQTALAQLCAEGLADANVLYTEFESSIGTLTANVHTTYNELWTTVSEAIDGETTNGTTQIAAIVTAITGLYEKLNTGLEKRFAESNASMRKGMQTSLNDDFDNKVCVEAEKAAENVQPWWKDVLKVILIIIVIVVVIVVLGPAVIAAVGGLAASAAGALGAGVALAGTIGAWVGAVVGGAIVGAIAGAAIQVGNNLIDAIGNGPLTWDKVTKGVWGAIVAGAIGGALGGLGGKFAQLLVGRLATAGIASGYQVVARYGVELAFDVVGSVLGDLANGNPITIEGIVKGAVIGIVVQKSMGGMGRYAKGGRQAVASGTKATRLQRIAMGLENIQGAAAAKGEKLGAAAGSKVGGKGVEWTTDALKTARDAEMAKQRPPTTEETPVTKPADETAPGKAGATEEPATTGKATQDADTVPESATKGIKDANRFQTPDGHTVTVTKDGPILRCSDPCEIIEMKYKDLIASNPEIARDIRMAKEFATANPALSRAKAQDAIDALTMLRNLEVADKLHGVVADPAAQTGLAKLAQQNNSLFDSMLAKLRGTPDELVDFGKFLNEHPEFAVEIGNRWNPALINEVLANPKLLKIMQANADNPRLLETMWDEFNSHRSPSKELKSDFVQYLGRRGYGLGGRTRTEFSEDQRKAIEDLDQRVKELSTLDEAGKNAGLQQIRAKSRALQLDIIATTEPELAAMIRNGTVPENLRTAVNDVLNDPAMIVGRTHVEDARSGIMSKLNENIGRNITDIVQFRDIINRIQQPSSRGAIGEAFSHQKKLMGEGNLQQPRIKVDDIAEISNKYNVSPDELAITPGVGGRTIDVKTGYSKGTIELDQLENYWQLWHQSQTPGSKINQRLAALGVPNGKLTGHDYLFLPGKGEVGAPTQSGFEAARKAFIEIQGGKYAQIVKIYYVDAAGVRKQFTAADLI